MIRVPVAYLGFPKFRENPEIDGLMSPNMRLDSLSKGFQCHRSFWFTSSGIYRKFASRLILERWVELQISGCRYHFRVFQIELNTLGIKNFEIGSVVEKLQSFEAGRILVPMVQISMKFDT